MMMIAQSVQSSPLLSSGVPDSVFLSVFYLYLGLYFISTFLLNDDDCTIGAIKSFTQQWSPGFAPVVSGTKAQKGNLALCQTGRVSPGLCHQSYLYLCLHL